MSVTYNAGSAIKQNVGELKNWDSWKPGSNHSWLLIAGAMDPPKGVVVSKRRDRGGKFLQGICLDLANMEKAIVNSAMGLGDLFNTVRDNYLNKSEAEIKLKQFLQKCSEEDKKPIIYYTGHGQAGTGNWCFQDGTLSIQDIEKLVCGQYPLIIADCCFSGHWATYCRKTDETRGFHTLSAAPAYSVSWDHPSMYHHVVSTVIILLLIIRWWGRAHSVDHREGEGYLVAVDHREGWEA